ncbi:hypothetical protein YC2023_081697 [Brassica napus]
MGLTRKIPRSLSMKTWISSTAKLTLHVLGADLTASRWMQEPSSGMNLYTQNGVFLLSDELMHPVNV